MEEISSKDFLQQYKKDPKMKILDVRTEQEYKDSHIPGAISKPLDQIDTCNLDKSPDYYVICRSGRRSSLACQQLQSQGYQVKNVQGGMLDWTGPTT
ncbi:rhodanese-like domain-containing protein [Alloiococcus otitis]|nr:rhodanese-like domain-containing protein [Alloiococcus otitis]